MWKAGGIFFYYFVIVFWVFSQYVFEHYYQKEIVRIFLIQIGIIDHYYHDLNFDENNFLTELDILYLRKFI